MQVCLQNTYFRSSLYVEIIGSRAGSQEQNMRYVSVAEYTFVGRASIKLLN